MTRSQLYKHLYNKREIHFDEIKRLLQDIDYLLIRRNGKTFMVKKNPMTTRSEPIALYHRDFKKTRRGRGYYVYSYNGHFGGGRETWQTCMQKERWAGGMSECPYQVTIYSFIPQCFKVKQLPEKES